MTAASDSHTRVALRSPKALPATSLASFRDHMSGSTRGSDAAAASSSAPQDGVAAWWPPRQGALNALGQQVRQQFNRLVFQIDAEQEARMRAYLDQTYGDRFDEGRRGKDRPIQMDSLRCVAGSRRASRPWAAGRPAAADARRRLRRPKHPVVREVPPPTSLDEEVARRLYDQLNAQKARSGCPASWRPAARCATPAPLGAAAHGARDPVAPHVPAAERPACR